MTKQKRPDSLNMRELADLLHQRHGLPKRFAEDVLKEILNAISRELTQSRKVRLRGFGTFEMRRSRGKLRPKFNPSLNFAKPFKKRRR